ncbi:MAG TPA: inorganic phosphate transporter [Gemmatimonadaceae bacterium]
MVYYVAAIVLIAFVFDFINGFHDSANSIATIVGTRVLSPFAAVLWAALWNFAAAFTSGELVAKAIQSGIIRTDIVTPNLILAGLLGAIVWNLITWFYGIPSSSSHALIGGYAGAGVAKAGFSAITWGTKWIQTLSFIVISPLVGMFCGFVLMVAVYWIFQKMAPARVDRFFRTAQLASSALLSHAHAANDAQKTMGIIVGLLVSVRPMMAAETGFLHHLYVPGDGIPLWVKLGAYTAISVGTFFGGWRIVHTMGSRITRLRPVSGFAAETGGAIAISVATHYGIPVSTTHTIAGSIMGAGATYRFSAVRWGIAQRIVWAWIITIPASAAVAAVSYWMLAAINP